MTMGSKGTVLVAGGSIGGLFAAASLQKAGWNAHIFERSGVELSGRGAGIVTHEPLIKALAAVGADISDLGVEVQNRVALDRSGAVVETIAYRQVVTSWDRIHQILRGLVPEGQHHLDHHVTGYRDTGSGVEALFADGSTIAGDVLIGADGFRSAIRGQMQPEVQSEYAGYVVWRTVADEAAIPPDIHKLLFGEFAIYAPYGTQVVGYPIAGPGNDLRPGHRRYNFVWYSPVAPEDLRDMLTDAGGTTHAVSIPPPLVREDVLARMMRAAHEMLPPPLRDMLALSERPFFTPIYDHCAPFYARGRVALSGDAACVARPHVGMGVTKAAEDARALAQHLQDGDVVSALQNYSDMRQPAGARAHAKGQLLGRYIFDGTAARNPDGAHNAKIIPILRDTAVPVDI